MDFFLKSNNPTPTGGEEDKKGQGVKGTKRKKEENDEKDEKGWQHFHHAFERKFNVGSENVVGLTTSRP